MCDLRFPVGEIAGEIAATLPDNVNLQTYRRSRTLAFAARMCHNGDMIMQSSLTFKIYCTNCYGTEIWKLDRIARMLSKIPATGVQSPLPPEPDIERIAEQFTAYNKQITCPGCGKTGTLTVSRLQPPGM